ncbi:hypothetical protein AB0J52_19605, partial [Spirillospora sp. NPDC049652]
MQCPTCGSTTAGTLDRCANCGTPTGAAAAPGPGGTPGNADPGFGDRTVVVPGPLVPGPGGQPSGGPGGPPAGFGGGQPPMPLSAPPAMAPAPSDGLAGGGDVPPPPAPAWAASEPAGGPAAGDPESTAAWVFDPAESGEHQSAPAD